MRARAREAARELLATGQGAAWKTSDDIGAFIEQVSRPMITESPSLRDSTKTRYLQPLDLILGRCGRHPHKAALAGMSIVTAGTYRRLHACLQDIARTHGTGTADHARAVLSKYILRPLVREGVLSGNPLAGSGSTSTAASPRPRRPAGRRHRRCRSRAPPRGPAGHGYR